MHVRMIWYGLHACIHVTMHKCTYDLMLFTCMYTCAYVHMYIWSDIFCMHMKFCAAYELPTMSHHLHHCALSSLAFAPVTELHHGLHVCIEIRTTLKPHLSMCVSHSKMSAFTYLHSHARMCTYANTRAYPLIDLRVWCTHTCVVHAYMVAQHVCIHMLVWGHKEVWV